MQATAFRRWATCFSAAALPFSLAVFWFTLHRGYPFYDAANFITADALAFNAFQSGDYFASLGHAYLSRGWKPTLTSFLIFPVFCVTADARLSVALSNLFCYAVFLIFLARFLGRRLPAPATVFSTWFIGTLPWTLIHVYQLGNDFPFVASAMACLYYLFENDGFFSRRRSLLAGFYLAIAFAFQPFVALVSIGPVYAYFIWRAHVQRTISSTDIFAVVISSAAAVGLPWMLDASQIWAAVALASIWIVLWVFLARLCKSRSSSMNLVWGHCFFLTIFLLWMAPFYRELITWSFMCTYEPNLGQASRLYQLKGQFFLNMYKNLGGAGFLGLMTAAAFFILRPVFQNRGISPEDRRLLIVALLLSGTIPMAMTTYGNADPRYHYLAYTFLYVAAFMIILGTASKATRVAAVALAGLGFCHADFTVSAMAGVFKGMYSGGGMDYRYLPPRLDDMFRDQVVVDSMRLRSFERPSQRVLLVDWRTPFPIPSMMQVYGLERGSVTTYREPIFLDAGLNVEKGIDWKSCGVDEIVLVFLPGQPPMISGFLPVYDIVAQRLIAAWEKKALDKENLTILYEKYWREQGACVLVLAPKEGPVPHLQD